MKIQSKFLGLFMIISIFGGISLTIFTGQWNTASNKEPIKYTKSGFEDQYNPADIRGSYTFEKISTIFKIEPEVLKKAFGLPNEIDITKFASKDLEEFYSNLNYEIGNGSVKLFVALYLNLPYTLEDDYLPTTAIDIIKEKNKNLTQEQTEYLNNHSVDIS